jgi:hypothetical protein
MALELLNASATEEAELNASDEWPIPPHASAASEARRKRVYPSPLFGATGSESRQDESDATASSTEEQPAPGTPLLNIVGMKKWEGRILEIDKEIFTAELVPLRERDGPAVIADFELDQLDPDADRAEPGDVFYLTVRTVGESSGYRTRTSTLRLRRLGAWSAEEMRRIRGKTKRRLDSLEYCPD